MKTFRSFIAFPFELITKILLILVIVSFAITSTIKHGFEKTSRSYEELIAKFKKDEPNA